MITADDIARADVASDPMAQMPVVLLELTDAGAERMRSASRANLRRPLAIVVDGEALSIPIVASEIGGAVQITLGGGVSHDEALLEANTLAVALSPEGRLRSRWTLGGARGP